jgi:hypothetical protein
MTLIAIGRVFFGFAERAVVGFVTNLSTSGY